MNEISYSMIVSFVVILSLLLFFLYILYTFYFYLYLRNRLFFFQYRFYTVYLWILFNLYFNFLEVFMNLYVYKHFVGNLLNNNIAIIIPIREVRLFVL
jgi:hypothetical protein